MKNEMELFALNNVVTEGVVRLALGIIKYCDYIENKKNNLDERLDSELDADSDLDMDLDAEMDPDSDADDIFSENVKINLSQIFKQNDKNKYCEKYKMSEVKNICIKNQTECDEYKKSLYEDSTEIVRIIVSYDKNQPINMNPIELCKDNVHDKIFYMSYFDTFDEFCEKTNKHINDYQANDQYSEKSEGDNFKFITESLKMYAEPSIMLILCFINYCEEHVSVDELKFVYNKMKPHEAQLIEITDLSTKTASLAKILETEPSMKDKTRKMFDLIGVDQSILNTMEQFMDNVETFKTSKKETVGNNFIKIFDDAFGLKILEKNTDRLEPVLNNSQTIII